MKVGAKSAGCGALALGLFIHFYTAPNALGQAAQTGLVAQVQGVGNVLHVISNLEKSLTFYHDVLGLNINRAPRGPADNPTAYIQALPIIPPMYLLAPNAQYRSAEMALAAKDTRLEMEDFKEGIGAKTVNRKLTDPGALLMSLTVRDLDPVVAKLVASAGEIVTPGRKPMTVKTTNGPQRQFVVKDTDGYYILLAQASEAEKAAPPAPSGPAPQGQGSGSPNVVILKLTLTVEDLEATLHFYRDELGFQPQPPTPFGTGLDVAGLRGVEFRKSESIVPGTQLHLDFVEFRGVSQKMPHPNIHDVGATILRLGVPDLNVLTQNLRNAGIPIISTTGQPTGNLLIARGPDDLYYQFFKNGQ